MVPPPMCGLGAEEPVQSNHCEEKGRRVRLSRISLSSKRLVSREIARVYALNAASDGAFAASSGDADVRRKVSARGGPGVSQREEIFLLLFAGFVI